MKPILSGSLSTFEVTQDASDKFNKWLQRRLDTSVWTHCTSWYRVGHAGRIFSNWPGPMVLFWWMLRSPRWSDYATSGPGKDAWERKRKLNAALRWLLLGGAAALVSDRVRTIVLQALTTLWSASKTSLPKLLRYA